MSEQKVKAKGTAKTEAIIGAASNKLVTATKGLRDAVETALKLVDTADEQALKIADNEEKLQNLEQEYRNKKAQSELEMEMNYKQNQAQFAVSYLSSVGKVAVDASEYHELEAQVEEFRDKFEEKVNAEVGKAKGMAAAELRNAQQLAEAQYQAKEAQNIAKINQLEAQLEFANQQTQLWKGQLDSERTAGVQRAQASAIGSVNVTPTNGR